MKKTFFAVFLAGATLGLGCPTTACDGDQIEFGRKEGEGRLVDGDRWESSPVDGNWIPFSHRRQVHFIPKELAGRKLEAPVIYISAASTASGGGSAFTLASGNLAELSVVGDTFFVYNNTCASYFMRAEVTAYPETPDGGLDAGERPPEASDASLDAADSAD